MKGRASQGFLSLQLGPWAVAGLIEGKGKGKSERSSGRRKVKRK